MILSQVELLPLLGPRNFGATSVLDLRNPSHIVASYHCLYEVHLCPSSSAMASTRRLVSYDDIDYGAAPVASTSASGSGKKAGTQSHPKPLQAIKQETAETLLQPSQGALLDPKAAPLLTQDARAASPGSSTNEGSLSYAKKKRLRRKRQLEAQQQASASQQPDMNLPSQKRQLLTPDDGTAEQNGVNQGKKRRRNEDNRLQRASLRQEMEEQWMGNGAAMGGLDYDGLTGEGNQSGSQPADQAVNGNAADRRHASADQSTAEGWKEAEGDDGWGDEGEQEYDEEPYEDTAEAYDEEDEEYDESIQAEWDAMARLNTSIAIPDIPPAFLDTGEEQLSNEPQARLEQVSDTASLSASAVAADGGRVLTEAELWDESALVDAWQAATEDYLLHSSKDSTATTSAATTAKQASALWHDAPIPGSKAAVKAQQISENNKEKRRLRLFLEEKARKAKEIEDLRQEVEKEQAQAQAQEEERQRQHTQAGTPDVVSMPASAPPAVPSAPLSSPPDAAMTKIHPVGKRSITGRAIPPSIGLPGNAAWQAACATVASTRNRIGGEARPPPLALPKLVEKRETQSAATVAAPLPPPLIDAPMTVNDTAMSIDPSASGQASSGTSAELPRAQTHGVTAHPTLLQPPTFPSLSHPDLASQTAPPFAPGLGPGVPPTASSDGSMSGELLQRICTSWYYAGYWTAQWEEEGRRRSRGERQE